MLNNIPEDMKDLVKELAIYEDLKDEELTEEEILNRVYLEIMPEEYDDKKEEEKGGTQNVIVIEM